MEIKMETMAKKFYKSIFCVALELYFVIVIILFFMV